MPRGAVVARQAGERADVDDRRARLHQRHERLDAEERTGHVHCEHSLQLLARDLEQPRPHRDARIVHEPVHATVLGAQPVGKVAPALLGGDVLGATDDAAVERRRLEICGDHRGALCGECKRVSRALPARRAGDHHDLAFDPSHQRSLRRIGSLPSQPTEACQMAV
jgi:hypothetical protein